MALGQWAGRRWKEVWNNGYYAVDVNWDFAQDIEANATTLAVNGLRVRSIKSGYTFNFSNCATGVGDFAGNRYQENMPVGVPSMGNWEHLTPSRQVSVPHNPDGTWKGGVYRGWVLFNSNLYSYNAPNTGWITFGVDGEIPTIPRATQATLNRSEAPMGETITINLPRHSGAFVHDLSYEFGADRGTIANGVGTSYTWTVPLSLANQIPNDTRGGGGIKVVTRNGSSVVGTMWVGFNATVPDNIKPSISNVSISEAEGTVSPLGVHVQGRTRLRVSFNYGGAYSSRVTTVQTVVEGRAYYGSPITTSTVYGSGNVPVIITVTDSRGRKQSVTVNANVLAYSPPSLRDLNIVRASDANGTESDTGSFAKATYSYSITSLAGKNDKSFKIEYLDGSTWVAFKSITDTYSKQKESFTGGSFGQDMAVRFRFTLRDRFHTISIEKLLRPGFVLMNFGADGKSLAIGQKSLKAGAFECSLPAHFYQRTEIAAANLVISGQKTMQDVLSGNTSVVIIE